MTYFFVSTKGFLYPSSRVWVYPVGWSLQGQHTTTGPTIRHCQTCRLCYEAGLQLSWPRWDESQSFWYQEGGSHWAELNHHGNRESELITCSQEYLLHNGCSCSLSWGFFFTHRSERWAVVLLLMFVWVYVDLSLIKTIRLSDRELQAASGS